MRRAWKVVSILGSRSPKGEGGGAYRVKLSDLVSEEMGLRVGERSTRGIAIVQRGILVDLEHYLPATKGVDRGINL